MSYASDGQVTLKCVATTLYELTVATSGTGTGSVTSSPTGINCGADCTEQYGASNVVTLTATPSSFDRFSGWSGACTGQSTTCQVTMDGAKSVTATFTDMTRVDITVQNSINTLFGEFGTNRITAPAINFACAQSGLGTKTCSVDLPTGTPISFNAEPAFGDSFDHWSTFIPACNNSVSPTCTFTVQSSANLNLTGVFSDS